MANVNYSLLQGWMGGGLTWNYFIHPIDTRFNDVLVVPNPPSTGNLEILRKWVVTSPQEDQLWYQVRNNTANAVYFGINLINIGP